MRVLKFKKNNSSNRGWKFGLAYSRFSLGFMCPVQAFQHRRHWYTGRKPGKAIQTGISRTWDTRRGWWKKRWKEGGNLTAIWGCKINGARLFPEMQNEMQQLQQGKFQLGIRKEGAPRGLSEYCNKGPELLQNPLSWRYSKLNWTSPWATWCS